MPDSKAGTWAAVNGAEIVNSQRTIAYINNFNLPIKVDADCWCPSIQDLLSDCPTASAVTGYEFPSTDPAPWYDPAIPESGDFLGFLVTEFDGLGSTYERSTFETLQGGAILGKLRPKARELRWQGFLFGRTCCAAEYGVRWLTAQLAGGVCDDCTDSDLDILLCCPEVTGNVPSSSCGTTTNPQIVCNTDPPKVIGPIPPFSESAAADAFRTFHRVGLADGPNNTQTRTIGCGTCEDSGGGCMIECDFTIIAGNPFMHRDPVLVCGPTPFPPCGDCDTEPADTTFWQKVNTLSYPASLADADSCEAALECTASPTNCVIDPDCPLAELPEIPGFEDPCGCDPIFTTTTCCKVSNDIYGQFFEGVPQIEVFSGDKPLYNVSIKIFENPQSRDCTDQDLFDICNLCAELVIRYVPTASTLSIDGVSKRISVECPGDNVQPGESLMSSSFQWPVFKCIDYIVKISADCCERPPISFVTVGSNNVNSNTYTGAGTLFVSDTTGFPTSGIVTVETKSAGTTTKIRLQYTGTTNKTFTGVTTLDGAAIVINTRDRVVGASTDTDCSKGVSTTATAKLCVVPREM